MSRFSNIASLFIFSVLLVGCDNNQPEQMLETYSIRVANSLNMDAKLDLSQPLKLPSFPRRRERIKSVTDLRQGVIEVLNLRHCQLLNLIAERNSSLGKVMQPSQKMVYEIKLYKGLRGCLQRLKKTDADPELIQQVQAIFTVKQDDFEAALWNGIFISEAVERNFSLSEPALSLAGEDGFSRSREALIILNKIASLNHNRDTILEANHLEQLETHLHALYTLRYGSRWLRSLVLIRDTLNHTASVIEQRLKKRPLCFRQQTTPKARIVKNVFNKYYAGQLQLYMARIDRQGKEWLRLNLELFNQFTDIPLPMQKYKSQILTTDAPLWESYIQSRDRHTKAWQTLLQQCNLMPGSS